jgi:glyoxylase-like metal-dependent hydrolase (beta-lactamase superfamily II)
MTGTDTITLGSVEITRVFEQASVAMPRTFFFPDVDDQLWDSHRDWLEPDFWDPRGDAILVSLRTWVLRSEGKTILVDTGVGNDRDRPGMPVFDHLTTTYLDNLAAAGVRPSDVDLVVITHVHPDHVGWNTQLVNDEWAPTFPNAQYLIPRADFDYWNPTNADQTRVGPRMQNVFEDSVLPVHQAGQSVLWEEAHDIDANLRLEPVPGHTPGSAVLWLHSESDRAAFVGDLVHTPLQIVEPDLCPCLDEDETAARISRRRILDSVANDNALMLPAHFPGAGAIEVQRQGPGYTISAWAPFQ